MYTFDGETKDHSFVRDSQGAFTTIEVQNSAYTIAQMINDSGQIVGYYRNSLSAVDNHGFLLDGGNFTTIDFPGALRTYVTSIDGAGQMFGMYTFSPTGFPIFGFVLNSGVFNTVTFPGFSNVLPLGKDQNGRTLGRVLAFPETSVLLLNDGSVNTINFPGALSTGATGINDSGAIVGRYNTDNVTQFGFLLNAGTFSKIEVSGAISTGARGISSTGQIVGDYDTDVDTHGFLATPSQSSGNTSGGSNIAVQPIDITTGVAPVTLTFADVTQSGDSSLSISGTGAPPPSGLKLGQPPTYYQLTTTATYSGSIEICINYSGLSFGNVSKLRLFHFENGAWIDTTVSLDTTNSIICGLVTSLSPFAIFESAYAATVQSPINVNNSSVFNANRGVVPVKFTLFLNDTSTCQLPAATISLRRTTGTAAGPVNQSEFLLSSDNGSNFRIENCQYIYNLASGSLGPGSYAVQIGIAGVGVGTAVFALR